MLGEALAQAGHESEALVLLRPIEARAHDHALSAPTEAALRGALRIATGE